LWAAEEYPFPSWKAPSQFGEVLSAELSGPVL